jgi:hypothetical protein
MTICIAEKKIKSLLQVITDKNFTGRLQVLSPIKVLKSRIQVITDKKNKRGYDNFYSCYKF